MRPSPDISGRPRRQAKNARRRGFFHVENVFDRQRRHRALQPAAIERVIWIGSKAFAQGHGPYKKKPLRGRHECIP